VDISGGTAYGRTVIDRRENLVTEEPNVVFAEKADKDFFYQWMYNILLNASKLHR
jgi:inosine-uridine nucleoside N-ribohydrolase